MGRITEVYAFDECDSASVYIQGNLIVLCPDTCSRLRRDPMPALRAFLYCVPGP